MNIFTYLEKMYEEVKEHDWEELELKYRRLALSWSRKDVVRQIDDVDMSDYEKDLMKSLSEAVETADKTSAGAIYFEYDMDNNWQGNFFVCPEYQSEEEEDDDWASEWDKEVEGPDLPAFTAIYAEFGGYEDKKSSMGVTLCLIARTVSVFGRCVDNLPEHPFAICIGFHDQDPIWRIREVDEEE